MTTTPAEQPGPSGAGSPLTTRAALALQPLRRLRLPHRPVADHAAGAGDHGDAGLSGGDVPWRRDLVSVFGCPIDCCGVPTWENQGFINQWTYSLLEDLKLNIPS